jgi:hypothetical protein
MESFAIVAIFSVPLVITVFLAWRTVASVAFGDSNRAMASQQRAFNEVS